MMPAAPSSLCVGRGLGQALVEVAGDFVDVFWRHGLVLLTVFARRR